MAADEEMQTESNDCQQRSSYKKSSKKCKYKEKDLDRKRNKKSKKKRRRDTSTSSDSSNSGEEVWVEKVVDLPRSETNPNSISTNQQEPLKRDEWMNLDSLFPCTLQSDKQKNKCAKRMEDRNQSILDEPGQSKRELNPYWKNGGTGLPQANKEKPSGEQIIDPVWLKKSLQRAQEQATMENRSLEEIAAERWGSLETIKSMIAEAETKLSNKHKLWNTKNDKMQQSYKSKHIIDERNKYNRLESRSRRHSRSRSRSRSRERTRKYTSYDRYDNFQQSHHKRKYQKPTDDIDDSSSIVHKESSTRKRNWQKERTQDSVTKSEIQSKTSMTKKEIESSSNLNTNIDRNTDTVEDKVLTEAEMNKLGAKIIKAELMGNYDLANELKNQLDRARKQSVNVSNQSQKIEAVENVYLTRTDSKGVTRPLHQPIENNETTKSKKKKYVDTHVSGERVRYFVDDDKYSLQQLFQREKGRSTSEDDAMFLNSLSKNMDMNDIFEEQVSKANTDIKQDKRDRMLAITEHKKMTKSLDGCEWCIESKNMLKHMIVAMDSDICLSLPSKISLISGHCILTPVHHVACQLQLDEDIWEKLKTFKEALLKMFNEDDKSVVFFEIYKNRHKFPHMQLECIPLPKESADVAPIYFKKALLECETEWAINKKIIDLHNKDIRKAIPNGLSYFMVQFGNEGGYAHVIEDERMFPKKFAQEIIGGILDLDHSLWRKPRKDSFEQQREKVIKFSKTWEKYNCIVQEHCK